MAASLPDTAELSVILTRKVMFFTGRLSLCFVAVSAAAAGEREAERVDGVQREVQGALRVAHQHGEQGLAERRHQH